MIPDGAVEAAARELFFQHSNTNGPSLSLIWDEALNEDLKSPFMRDARAALEAAAPFMAAQALRDAVDAFPLETITAPDNAVVWLRRRAEQLGG